MVKKWVECNRKKSWIEDEGMGGGEERGDEGREEGGDGWRGGKRGRGNGRGRGWVRSAQRTCSGVEL